MQLQNLADGASTPAFPWFLAAEGRFLVVAVGVRCNTAAMYLACEDPI